MDIPDLNLKSLIQEKERQILLRTNSGIHEHQNFRKLRAILSTYKDKRPVSGTFTLMLTPEHVEQLVDDASEKVFNVIDSCISKAKNHVVIDLSCSMVSCDRLHHSSSLAARRLYIELSSQYCVFVFNNKEIQSFVNGDDVGELIFLTKEDEARFKEKKGVTELDDLFDEYRNQLSIRDRYHKFFASLSAKKALYQLTGQNDCDKVLPPKERKKAKEQFLKKHRQLLENKPEDRFREDLRKYLDDNLRGDVAITKEHLLENFKRIDILITDEYGDLFLVEVKWVGVSIHSEGNKIGTSYCSKDINPNAIVQTIDYLIALQNNNKHIKVGYLVVFNADELLSHDTVDGFDCNGILSTDQLKYYPRFKKVPDFRVVNVHPN